MTICPYCNHYIDLRKATKKEFGFECPKCKEVFSIWGRAQGHWSEPSRLVLIKMEEIPKYVERNEAKMSEDKRESWMECYQRFKNA